MKVVNKQIETNTILNATKNGAAFPLDQLVGFALQIEISGTPTGVFKLQVSCDPSTKAPTNWVEKNRSCL